MKWPVFSDFVLKQNVVLLCKSFYIKKKQVQKTFKDRDEDYKDQSYSDLKQ